MMANIKTEVSISGREAREILSRHFNLQNTTMEYVVYKGNTIYPDKDEIIIKGDKVE